MYVFEIGKRIYVLERKSGACHCPAHSKILGGKSRILLSTPLSLHRCKSHNFACSVFRSLVLTADSTHADSPCDVGLKSMLKPLNINLVVGRSATRAYAC